MNFSYRAFLTEKQFFIESFRKVEKISIMAAIHHKINYLPLPNGDKNDAVDDVRNDVGGSGRRWIILSG